MAHVIENWVGFKKCDRCGAEADRPCWRLTHANPTPANVPHPGRGKDSSIRRAIGNRNRAVTRAFNKSIGLP